MAESETLQRILNPLVLNLRKMELELKCPTCLNLLDMPMMLPCTHIFCSHCIPIVSKNGSKCPSCKSQFLHQDVISADHLKPLVQICKEMSHVVAATTFPHQKSKEAAETIMFTKESPMSGNNYIKDTQNEKSSELQTHASEFLFQREGKSNGSAVQKGKKHKQHLCKEVDSESAELLSPPSFGSSKDFDGDNTDCANRQPETGTVKKRRLRLESEATVKDEPGTGIVKKRRIHLESKATVKDKAKDWIKCMFCHSKEITEGSGPMVHFVNRKVVGLAEATQTKAIHVHEKCYQWSPQIYYENEKIMNLEVELARASRIKCSKCNVKGAALGCYIETCRRSYHVPCAYYLSDIRWDCENYLMLCPSHSSRKFPCEESKSKSQNNDNNLVDPSDLTDEALTQWNKDWVFCGSALSNEEKSLLEEFACLSGASVIFYWDSSVSHVIASVDENGGCSRTVKVLMSILTGKWVLTMEWVKACMEAGKPVPEEQYEITHDAHGCYDGPKTGRLRSLQKAPKLLEGLTFYVTDNFLQPTIRKYIEDLISTGGGKLIALNDVLQSRQVNDKSISQNLIIVYDADQIIGDSNESMKRRIKEAEALAAGFGGKTIAHTAFLNNIAACEFLVI